MLLYASPCSYVTNHSSLNDISSYFYVCRFFRIGIQGRTWSCISHWAYVMEVRGLLLSEGSTGTEDPHSWDVGWMPLHRVAWVPSPHGIWLPPEYVIPEAKAKAAGLLWSIARSHTLSFLPRSFDHTGPVVIHFETGQHTVIDIEGVDHWGPFWSWLLSVHSLLRDELCISYCCKNSRTWSVEKPNIL